MGRAARVILFYLSIGFLASTLRMAWIVIAQEPAPQPREVTPPDTTGLDLSRWGWSVDVHVIQVRLNDAVVHESAVNGLPQLAAEVSTLAKRYDGRGLIEMRIYSTIADHWCRADGSRLDTREGWFGVEVKVHAGILTL